MSRSEARGAENEAIFREANERIESKAAGLANVTAMIPFLCECEDSACFDFVRLTASEYETVRAHPMRFLMTPGHEAAAAAETVLERNERFQVVEKKGEGGDIAAARNRRD